MKQQIKVMVLMLLISFLFREGIPPVFSATSEATLLQSKIKKLYGLEYYNEGGSFGTLPPLKLTEKTLEAYPPGMIKEITDYYKKRGYSITIRYIFVDSVYRGTYNMSGKRIHINIHQSGFSESVVAHEMGHFIENYIRDTYGYTKFKNAWQSLNGKYAYPSKLTDEKTYPFVNDYAAKSYSEDVASCFEYLYGRQDQLRDMLKSNPSGAVAKKMNLIQTALTQVSQSFKKDSTPFGKAVPEKRSLAYAKDYELAEKERLIPGIKVDDTLEILPNWRYVATSPMKRVEALELIEHYLTLESQLTLQEFTKNKGKKADWYIDQSLYLNNDYKMVLDKKTNFVFKDMDEHRIHYLYALGIVSLPSHKQFSPEMPLTGKSLADMFIALAKVNGISVTREQIMSEALLKSPQMSYEQAVSCIWKLHQKMKGSFLPAVVSNGFITLDAYQMAMTKEVAQANEMVTFVNPEVEQAVRDALQTFSSPLYGKDLKKVKSLTLDSLQNMDLSDLGQLFYLENLYINNSELLTFPDLQGHPYLEVLDLSFCHLSDVTGLTTLPSLKTINMTGNPISEDHLRKLIKQFPQYAARLEGVLKTLK